MSGVLYVVATPIGNLRDITLRALDILKSVDGIVAEDTRHSAQLLKHYAIKKPLLLAHAHNEAEMTDKLCAMLAAGSTLALLSDAGTPAVSDPGGRIVRAAKRLGLRVVPIPGASALTSAFSVAGISEGGFYFHGFLPATRSARRTVLTKLNSLQVTFICFEAPHRIVASVQDIAVVLGEARNLTICRELSKIFETIFSGTAHQALAWLEDSQQRRGEFVLVVEAYQAHPTALPAEALRVLKVLLDALPLKLAVQLATDITQQARNELYRCALQIKSA